MTIAITGATSMLGIATIKQCIDKNYPVLAFVHSGSKKIELIPQSKLISLI